MVIFSGPLSVCTEFDRSIVGFSLIYYPTFYIFKKAGFSLFEWESLTFACVAFFWISLVSKALALAYPPLY